MGHPACHDEGFVVARFPDRQTPLMAESSSPSFQPSDLEPTSRTKCAGRPSAAATTGRAWSGRSTKARSRTSASSVITASPSFPWCTAALVTRLYLHGAIGNAMLRRLSDGVDVCVTVTIVDAHVLSRSAFHHSMNYRSVVAFGEDNARRGPRREAPSAAGRCRPQSAGPFR